MEMTKEQWNTLSAALAAPFPPEQVSWRVKTPGKVTPNTETEVLAYIDARDVQDRLDAVVGAGSWSFDWQPIVTDAKGLLVAKGTITIYGVSKSDIGDASNFEGNKGCISDTFKRTAVQWGVGRYLYGLDNSWVKVDGRGQIDAKARAALRAKLTGKATASQAAEQSSEGTPTLLQRKEALKASYAALGIRDKDWVKECCISTKKTSQRLAEGFTEGDLEKISDHLEALRKKGAPIAADTAAAKAGVA